MNSLKELHLDLEIAWYWAMSKHQQSLRNSNQSQRRELLMVNHR